MYGALVFGVASLVFSAGGLLFLMQYPSFMIKAGLIFTGVMALVSCVYIFMMPGDMTYKAIYGSLSIIFFLITLCYIRAVWSRIPFVSRSLLTHTIMLSHKSIFFYSTLESFSDSSIFF